MATVEATTFFTIPYRDTANRILVEQQAIAKSAKAFTDKNLGVPFTRYGYWYDMQNYFGGGSFYSGSDSVTLASTTVGPSSYGYAFSADVVLTGPVNMTAVFYGLQELTATPVVEAAAFNVNQKTYRIFYVSSTTSVDPEHKAVFNAALPPLYPSNTMKISVFGNSAGPALLNFLFAVSEQQSGEAGSIS